MGYFVNRRFNLIYVHAALQGAAMHGGEAFAFVYLLKAGIAAPIVLLAIGAMFFSRLLFRKLVLPLVKRVGLRKALIFSILVEAATYPILSQISEVGFLLVVYLTFWAISSSMYWTTYHAYVALLGDNEHRGAQVSVMESLGIAMGIVAPLAMGLLLTTFTPLIAFGAIALVMAAAAIPIWLGPDFAIAPNAMVPQATRQEARLLMFTDGLRSGAFHFTWLIALFITLGGSYVAYGGAMAFAAVVGAIGGLVLGKVIDLGHGKRAAQLGFAALSIAVVARAVGYPVPWTAFVANAVAALAWPLYATIFNSRIYQLARQSACPLRYHIVAEGGWDLGTGLSCAISALLVYAGFTYFWPLMVALIGCALGYVLLTRTLEQRPLEAGT